MSEAGEERRRWWPPVLVLLASVSSVKACMAYGPVGKQAAYTTARAGVGADVNALLAAEVAHKARTGEWLRFGDATTALESLAESGEPSPSRDEFATLKWAPVTVGGDYWVQVASDGRVSAWGISDLDGDGDPAMWKATEAESAALQTADFDY